ncbi:hypothetical protein [Neisseria canis]|uniref:Periplasmic protein n=1 Tax=Neisseria canis TaxID=493 RepID=A0A1X3CZC0_9NEIS|nr:hypothetical protein [Neisseria canis]OSI12791.1 hypothetical protein BWD07_03895 [Neisseria canis]VEF00055.1 Uncharacterised protein [Neisseria canis]
MMKSKAISLLALLAGLGAHAAPAQTGGKTQLQPGQYQYALYGPYGPSDFRELVFVHVLPEGRYCMFSTGTDLSYEGMQLGKWRKQKGNIMLDNQTVISNQPVLGSAEAPADDTGMKGALLGKQPALFINARNAEYQAYHNKQALEKARAECVEMQKNSY